MRVNKQKETQPLHANIPLKIPLTCEGHSGGTERSGGGVVGGSEGGGLRGSSRGERIWRVRRDLAGCVGVMRGYVRV